MTSPERFAALWGSLSPIGQAGDDGGYLRHSWTDTDLVCREWFVEEALDRDLEVEIDRNGNLWAWWGEPEQEGAVVTGSHLDSVPHGGAYDGPLGVVSGLLAVDRLRERGVRPIRPIAVVVFTEEEGARFGVPCLGSRLMTGAFDAAAALRLRDRDGVWLADAIGRAGLDPDRLGPDPERLARIGAFVELHVEQGRALDHLNAPVGVASAIWPHGRYRFDFTGEGNHAGTTRMSDRHDPMLTLAHTVVATDEAARTHGAHATVGRVEAAPNATNAIAARASAWLDARAADGETLQKLVDSIRERAEKRARMDGTHVTMTAESITGEVGFTGEVSKLAALELGAPVLPTGAGHDAGVLSGHVDTAMLFVRNPTGISHAPQESASAADCSIGVEKLTDLLARLCR
ncbi:allantoate amidohydrolase [Dactylosporangium matsuzakiense]|uniref:Zn-dependent hydrolase n=1 Tax=Dactylosporangium matsuzakiense TaxID=53360 RepID=A0A9W6NLB9_9ACTN|nr:allantoate amidohydrolase [Dactylosporangium matsuzakiense]UWZ44027.1 allantoate amidohydrolase [Dactylosporangium matsuzakiense]GLL00717.1 Zn-dependent hydrolase [Dactylosporangium matsuzakiense]